MPKYNLTKEVPWRSILHALHWYLECQVSSYPRETLTGRRQEAKEFLLGELRQSYHNYHSLREFLGYRNPTKLDLEARALLSGQNVEP